jgi:iron complex transport system substrate-binding protein
LAKAASRRPRIVAPDATSILLALGAGRELVGVSRWCADVCPVGRRPRLGDCWAVDAEQVARLKPSLVIGSVPFKSEVVADLLSHPMNFLALNPRSITDIYSSIQLLGTLTGRESAARKLVGAMTNRFATIERLASKCRNSKREVRVYAEAWPNPRISSPPWVAELIQFAGGKMLAPPGSRVSDEDVVRARPEVIILAWTATGTRAQPERILSDPAWQDVPAVRDKRVVVISDELLNTPGPPLLRGAVELFNVIQAIHPEIP